MLTCKEITHLLSESQDRKLSISEKVQLEMHLAMCKGCRNFGYPEKVVGFGSDGLQPTTSFSGNSCGFGDYYPV